MEKKTSVKHHPWFQGYNKYGDKVFNNKWESFIHSTNIYWVPTGIKIGEYERIVILYTVLYAFVYAWKSLWYTLLKE